MKTKNLFMIAFVFLGISEATAQTSWQITGNAAGTNDFLGTTNSVSLKLKVNNMNSGVIDNTNFNACFGYQSGSSFTLGTARYNSSLGHRALAANTTGIQNVAIGWNALSANVAAGNNTAVGTSALSNTSNSSANANTAVGTSALGGNQGSFNLGLGLKAGNISASSSCQYNTFLGSYADVYAASLPITNSTALGANSVIGVMTTTALNNGTAIGAGAIVDASDRVRIGNTSVTSIEGQVAYTFPSDGRFKENVTEEVKGLEFIKLLRPVVYNFNTRKFEEFLTKGLSEEQRKKHFEGVDFGPSTAIRQSGFIAQEVEKAAKQTGYDFNGLHVPKNSNDHYSIAYSEFVVPLVKAVQEQQIMIEQQKALIEQQKTDNQLQTLDLQKQIEDQKKLIMDLQKSTTGINQVTCIDGFSMEQNIPNPFGQETTIKYTLPNQVQNAVLNVYDLTGKQLSSFPLTQKGTGSLTISSDKLAAGIYIYSITADGKVLDSKRMIVSQKQ